MWPIKYDNATIMLLRRLGARKSRKKVGKGRRMKQGKAASSSIANDSGATPGLIARRMVDP
jgi:hypothetical protein